MSLKLFSHNADLQQLRAEGYFVQIIDEQFLVVRHVPYVNGKREVGLGTLVTALELAGDTTQKPLKDHQVFFDGEYPCDAQGARLQLGGEGPRREVGPGLFVRHHFSQKAAGGYADYHHKMVTYHAMLAAPASAVDPSIKPRQFAAPTDDDPDSIFEYPDTASGRNGTAALATRFKEEVVSFAGLGGTGGYVLDKVANAYSADCDRRFRSNVADDSGRVDAV